MDVNMLLARLWNRLTGRSATSAAPAVPYVPPNPTSTAGWSSSGLPLQPRECNVEVYSIGGLQNELSQVERRYRSADGGIVRHYEDRRSLVAGCGHTAVPRQDNSEKYPDHRGIGGLCSFCLREYYSLVEKGQMDPLEAERLSIVCTDCARMSVSGHLCCPRHRKAMVMPDGTTQYIDPDTAKSMSRQNTMAKALHAATWLFTEPQNPQEPKTPNQKE